MLVVNVLAAPGGLPSQLVEDLRAAWTGGPVCWLSPGEAAEFNISDEPADLWAT